ncbi:MAG: GGDEF domain-containing protein [Burkholderiaceae bacterium]|nr:GGDEF domain-containing protein [Burkholderiaceae bacterium]
MNAPGDDDADMQRLVALRREIAEAESILLALQAAIQDARSDPGLLAMSGVAAENERLAADNLAAREEATSAYAALEDAVHVSRTDALTGLLNRSALRGILDHDLELARRNGTLLVVYFIDIDNFKAVNDTLGHGAGDVLLQAVASVLIATVRASDIVCRIGGDEFVVFTLTNMRDDALLLARKLDDSLRRKFVSPIAP